MAFGLSAGAVTAIGLGVGALTGGGGGSSQSGTQTTTTQQTLDPRAAEILYGANGNDGFLSRIMAAGNQPQNADMARFGTGASKFLGGAGSDILTNQSRTANYLQGGGNPYAYQTSAAVQGLPANFQPAQIGQAAQVANVPGVQAARAGNYFGQPTERAQSIGVGSSIVNAPAQNRMDLTGSYDSLINSDPGANPFLTGAIGRGINQSKNAFADLLSANTKNLTENVLPGIRSGAVASGSYGGGREGIAQGKALDAFVTGNNQALERFAQGNTDAAVSAQAGEYGNDRNRQLAATQGLGAQQYGVAQQNSAQAQQAMAQSAANQQQAGLFNAGASNSAGATDAAIRNQNNLFDAGNQQAANMANFGAANQKAMADAGYTNQNANQNALFDQQSRQAGYAGALGQAGANAGYQQQANLVNRDAYDTMAGRYYANINSGMAANSGLLNQAYGYGSNQDAYGLTKQGQIGSIASPYLQLGGGVSQSSPLYQNQGAGILGGALTGAQIGRQFGGSFGNNSNNFGNFLGNNSSLNLAPSDLFSAA